jgi:hypothetical protein
VLCPHCQRASKNHAKGDSEAENYEWNAQIAFARCHSRNIYLQKSGALLDVGLRHFLLFAQHLQPISDDHHSPGQKSYATLIRETQLRNLCQEKQ